jgi:curved DNA-binding protein
MATKRDYYAILDVSKNASSEDIKKAYRRLALKHHPDRDKSPDAEEIFKEINEAYEVLSNPQKRQVYDRLGRTAFTPGGTPGFTGQTWQEGPFTYTFYGPGDFSGLGGFSDPFEIFEAFFGGASPFRREAPKPTFRVTLEFLEAVRGIEKKLVIQGEEKKIKIPAGVRNGSRIRFKDFNLLVEVKSHPEFHREGYDVWLTREISLTKAVLGSHIKIPTVEGERKLKIPAGVQPGTVIRLKGLGVPLIRGTGRGDQYVKILVKIPKKLKKEEKRLYEQLSKIEKLS